MHVKIFNAIKSRLIFGYKLIRNFIIFSKQYYLRKKVSPIVIHIEPTNICNANCIFCAYQYYKAPKRFIENEVLHEICRQAKEIGVKRIDLTPFAGEILVDKDIISKIKIISSYGFESIFTYTNLLNLHRFDIREFLSSGLTSISISCGPLDEELYNKIYRTNRYQTFLQNLITLLKTFNQNRPEFTVKNIRIEFRSNISKEECLKLNDYTKYIAPLISSKIQVVVMTVFDSWMNAIKSEDLLSGMTLKKANGRKLIPCSRLNNIQVLSNGDIRVCGCRFNPNSTEDIFFVGNIKDTSIIEAYNSEKTLEIKKSFLKGNPPIECQLCSWYE